MNDLWPNVPEGHVSRAREAGKEAGGAGVRACVRSSRLLFPRSTKMSTRATPLTFEWPPFRSTMEERGDNDGRKKYTQ